MYTFNFSGIVIRKLLKALVLLFGYITFSNFVTIEEWVPAIFHGA